MVFRGQECTTPFLPYDACLDESKINEPDPFSVLDSFQEKLKEKAVKIELIITKDDNCKEAEVSLMLKVLHFHKTVSRNKLKMQF